MTAVVASTFEDVDAEVCPEVESEEYAEVDAVDESVDDSIIELTTVAGSDERLVAEKDAPVPPPAPQLKMQVLIFHGLQDRALSSDALNNTWDWIDNDLTIVTTPVANHFVQQDAPELVTSTMKWWLKARR